MRSGSAPKQTQAQSEQSKQAERNNQIAMQQDAADRTIWYRRVYGQSLINGRIRPSKPLVPRVTPKAGDFVPRADRVPGTSVVGPAGNYVGQVDSQGRIRRDGDAGGRR